MSSIFIGHSKITNLGKVLRNPFGINLRSFENSPWTSLGRRESREKHSGLIGKHCLISWQRRQTKKKFVQSNPKEIKWKVISKTARTPASFKDLKVKFCQLT